MERARNELYRSEFRLDLDLLVIVDDSPDLDDRLRRMPGRFGQWIPWPARMTGVGSLREHLEQALPLHDVFEETLPVRGRQVIGRAKEVADIAGRIESAGSVGVFGLRKVGKTSVVRAATDALDPVSAYLSLPGADVTRPTIDPRVLVFWLDVQRAYDRDPERLLGLLAEAIRKRIAAGGISPHVRARTPLDRIEELLARALSKSQLPVCIVLDEYDFLFEGSGGQPPIPGVELLLRQVRGIAQETGRLSLLMIGRDSRFLQRPEMRGYPNPMLGWLVERWIGPLGASEASELLIRLGARVRLEVGERTTTEALALTSGHPLLHRQFGSALFELAQASRREPGAMPTDGVAEAAILRFHERQAVRDLSREVLQLTKTRFPAAYALLIAFARDGARAVADHGGWSGPAALPLRNYGILGGDADAPTVNAAVLHFTRTFHSQSTLGTTASAAPTPAQAVAAVAAPPGQRRRRRRGRRRGRGGRSHTRQGQPRDGDGGSQ